jgi:hypothetical protein
MRALSDAQIAKNFSNRRLTGENETPTQGQRIGAKLRMRIHIGENRDRK